MFFQRGPQFFCLYRLDHLRQRLQDLLLRVEQIANFVNKQLFQILETHRASSCNRANELNMSSRRGKNSRRRLYRKCKQTPCPFGERPSNCHSVGLAYRLHLTLEADVALMSDVEL